MDTPPDLMEEEDPPKPGWLLLTGTTLLVLLNMWLGFAREMRSSGNISAAIGGGMAQLMIPIAAALLFSIARRFRNERSRTRVVFWSSVLLFLSVFAAPKVDPEAKLAAEVQKLNTGPRMIDSITRFDRVTQGPGMRITVYETLITMNAADVPRRAWLSAVPKLRQQMLEGPPGKLVKDGVTVTYRYSGKDGVLIGDVSSNP
jgi:hypothetical protein